MNPVKVKNIEIGTGMPKIIVPIVGVTKEEILTTARSFHTIPLDVVEWRADWFEGVFDFTQVEDVLKELRNILGETPLLMTFRTSAEGGEKSISVDAYKELNIHASQTGNVDLIDVEIFIGDDTVSEIIAGAHAAGVKVIASNHDFTKHLPKRTSSIVYVKCKDMGLYSPKSLSCHKSKKDVLDTPLRNRRNDTLSCHKSNYNHVYGRYRCPQSSLR